MDNKKLLKYGSIAAVVLMTLFAITVLTDDSRSFQRVDTSVAIKQLELKNVAEAKIEDREQRLRLKLKKEIAVDEREVAPRKSRTA